jgi:hypothetical protein
MTMCAHGHERAGRRGRRGHFRRFGNRSDWLTRLEEYQRDLEQELADVADLVRRLREESPPESPPQTASV